MEERFDRELWLKDRGNRQSDSARMRMSGVAIENLNKRPGQYDKTSIIKILGEPDEVTNDYFFYFVGIGEFSVSGSYLAVEFDVQGKIARAFLTRR